MNKILPWIPIFGGIYCNLTNPSKYFTSLDWQFVNFIYHVMIMFITFILIYNNG